MGVGELSEFNSVFILTYIKEFFDGTDSKIRNHEFSRGDNNWFTDQHMVSVKIVELTSVSKRFGLEKIKYKGDRFARGFYTFEDGYRNVKSFHRIARERGLSAAIRIVILKRFDIMKFTDFHSFHKEVYRKLELLEYFYGQIFDSKTNELINKYVNDFLAIRKELKNESMVNVIS